MEKKAVPVLPMSRAEMEKAIEELEAKLEASYEIKFRDLQASQEKTVHALTRKQEVLEAVKLGLAEKVLGTHQYLMTTKPPAALALSPPGSGAECFASGACSSITGGSADSSGCRATVS